MYTLINRKNFSNIFANDSKISFNILLYLTEKDTIKLSNTSKVLHSKVNELIDNNFSGLFKIWQKNNNKNDSEGTGSSNDEFKENNKKKITKISKKKKNHSPKVIQKINDNIMKMNIFALTHDLSAQISPYKLMDAKTIKLGSNSSSELQDKLFKENTNFFFGDELGKNIIVVNRSLIDSSLNMECAGNKNDQHKYSSLYESEKFTNKTYDFSNINSLIERQKEILNAMKQEEIQSSSNLIKTENLSLADVLDIKRITLVLCHGGYFVIAVYEKNKCIFHKSDHKYVVRKKAGQRQISKDSNSGSQIQSMGSQIRRANEKKHQENIKKILSENYKIIENSDLILYHAPGMNKYLIFDEEEPTWKIRHKFRSICMTTKKANYTEVERIYKAITKIYMISI